MRLFNLSNGASATKIFTWSYTGRDLIFNDLQWTDDLIFMILERKNKSLRPGMGRDFKKIP